MKPSYLNIPSSGVLPLALDYQFLFNLTAGSFAAVGGWFFRMMWTAIQGLQRDDRALAEKVGLIETLVLGNYITHEKHAADMARIEVKLDRHDDKLDKAIMLLGKKADRGEK